MKKKKITIAILTAAVLFAVGSIALGFAADTAPGTAADPVVTKSYVDKAIAALKASIKTSAETSTATDISEPAASSSWEAKFFTKGSTVVCEAGTQLIMRSGQSTVYDLSDNGLSDLSAGSGIYHSEALGLNHLVLVPAAGRGVVCTTDCWFMVQGKVSVE